MKFSFFRGCFIPIRYPHIEEVSRKVLPEIGVELVDVDSFTCCPEGVAMSVDKMTWLTVAARNIAIAEDVGHDIITLCNGCTYTLKQTNTILKENEELKEKVNEVLSETDKQYKGTINVKHFSWVLKDDIGLDKVKEKAEVSLSGLNVASHTGCHIISPLEVMSFDDPFEPVVVDEMVSTLGATPVDYLFKPLCCGWTLSNFGTRDSANELLGTKLRAMQEAGADCITVLCPQCYNQFDTGQMMAGRALKLEFKLPVLFYTELMALSMGYSLDEIHYRSHRIRDDGFSEKIGRL